jgi:hypothetical protein
MDRDTVKVIDDALAGFEGEVVSVDRDKVSLRVSVFGRETPAELRHDRLEDVDAADHATDHKMECGCGTGSPSSTSG